MRCGLRRASWRALSTTFYDSQSGRMVEVPTGIQCHVGMHAVATDRMSAALAHLLKNGNPVKGIASVLHPVVDTVEAVSAMGSAANGGGVCISVTSDASVAALKAAHGLGLRARALMSNELCMDPYAVQLIAANLGDAGAEAILLSIDAATDVHKLREMVDMACEVDLLGVPMRSRLGLRIGGPTAQALKLASYAHDELKLLHFYACLAGTGAPRPSDLLPALGLKKPDYNFGSLVLAEHVPHAA